MAVDHEDKEKIAAAIRLAGDQDRFAASIRNAQTVGLTKVEIGQVTGLTVAEVAGLLRRWGLDT